MKLKNSIFFALVFLFGLSQLSVAQSGNSRNLKPGKQYFQLPPKVSKCDFLEKTVILKIKKELRHYCTNDQVSIAPLQQLLSALGASGIEKKFPQSTPPEREKNKYGMKYADLSLIYEFNYTADIPVEKVINSIYSLDIVEYSEPHYVYQLQYTPNDPSIGLQWHIGKIKAYQAWDISKGDTNVVIGIIDTGTDIDHPDLVDQFKYNYSDPIDGSDNDTDGYTDNFRGWDLQDNDNNPQVTVGNDHGVHVAGDASPSTDNGIGVAGAGFKCKLLPVRAGNTTIPYGYEGITYAADHGADVINCSWGGPGGGQLGQDVIDYATINKDALVVAAAGNDGTEDLFYPAGYNYVLNVAATESNDTKSGFSNYGYNIDVCAPGSSIYSTGDGGIYYYSDGTSMASPVAAGCAALIRANYPIFDAIQAGEQLKVTADNIYPLNNIAYKDKLGTGRVNLFAAISGINSPSVVMTERNISDGNDEAFVVGDTLRIDGIYTNFLAPSGNITATLSAFSANVSIIDSLSTLGVITAFGGTANNNTDPYLVRILPGAQLNERVTFQLLLSDGTYSTKVFFQIIVNVDYINITINDVATSITSKSLIGFNDFSTQLEGLGFIYPYTGNAVNLLFDGGLMVGVVKGTDSVVSDNVRNTGGVDMDFVSVSNVQRVPVPIISELDLEGIFKDNGATTPLSIEVAHKAFAWSKAGHRKYVIVEYNIKNKSLVTLSNLYAGIYTDWDIADYSKNIAATDQSRFLGYTYHTAINGYYAGIQALSPGGGTHYAMFNNAADDPGGTGVHPNNSYTSANKYTTLSNAAATAGGSGADVSNVVSSGPFNIASGDSVTVAFAVLAGDNLADLQATADSAYMQYNGTPLGILNSRSSDIKLFPNPSDGIVSIKFEESMPDGTYELEVKNLLGQDVYNYQLKISGAGTIRLDLSFLEKGLYFLILKNNKSESAFKILINRN